MFAGLKKKLLPQPTVAIALTVGVASLLWFLHPDLLHQFQFLTPQSALIMLALIVGLIIANEVTIQISYHTKTTLSDTLLLLISVMLTPALALVVTLLAQLISLIRNKQAHRLYWSDIVTDSCRFALLCFVASASYAGLAYMPFAFVYYGIPALILLIGDCLTMPLVIGPITGARPVQIMQTSIRNYVQIDGIQYLIAVPIAVITRDAPTLLPFFILPVLSVYRLVRSRYHLQHGTRALLEQMADMVDLRDPYTGGHSRRVAEYTARLLNQIHLEGHDVDLIVTAARIHDIGKIGIPDAILKNPGRLTDAERRVMEQHPVLGATLLARYPDFVRGVAIVRHHHERIDGTGYPDRLREHDIPFGARIIAVADTWDALTSDRPYRAGMAVEHAVKVMCEGRGTQWSADLVDALLIALGHTALLQSTLELLTEAETKRQTVAGHEPAHANGF